MRRHFLIVICLCGVATHAPRLFADDQIATVLDAAKDEHRSTITGTRETLLAEFADEAKKLTGNSRLAIAEKVRLATQLSNQQKAFEKDGTMPSWEGLKLAVKQFERKTQVAHNKLEAAFDKAARDYDKSGDLASAKKVLEEKARFTASKDGRQPKYVVIASPATGKIVAVDGGSSKVGARVIQWELQKLAANQNWELVPTDEGWFHIKNRRSGLVMAIEGGTDNDGANVIQYPATANEPDHQWKTIPADEKNKKSKSVLIVNRRTGKALSLEVESRNNGIRLVQSKEIKGAKHQHWTLISVE